MKRKICALLTAIMLLVLMAAGCTKTEANDTQTTDPNDTQTTEETATETSPAQETDAPSTAKGTVVIETVIKNPEGKYAVTVPEEWIGKTSYELDGTATHIYHITQSDTEPELNPELINIGMVAEGEVAVGEVFIEIDGVKYYSIPRLDFPYNADSDDAKEFTSLYDQVPVLLKNFRLMEEGEALEETDQPTPFTSEDTYFSDIHIGDSKEDVLAKVGEPQNASEIVWEATGETRDVNEFSFGQLVFVEGKLVTAQITDATYSGPRGIIVGMKIDEVAARFAAEKEIEDQTIAIYYRANPGDDILFAVPPSAVLYKGDMQTLAYSVFTEESGADSLTVEQLKDEYNYMYMEQYDLVCQFDAQGVMLSFSVRLGAPSE